MSSRPNHLRLQAVEDKSAGTKSLEVGDEIFKAADLLDFPTSSSVPNLPVAMPDELVDFYAFLFCQRGFRQLGMTFEQFLLVIAAIVPGEMSAQ
ncbi:MAG: hypothetical protein ABSD30_22640 [Candidatus Binatus sp.]|jgi:hypothetical protein